MTAKHVVATTMALLLGLGASLGGGAAGPATKPTATDANERARALLEFLRGAAKDAPEPASQKAPDRSDRPWTVVGNKEFTIAVPKGWRRLPEIMGPNIVYMNGDGIGAPMADETGSPIQIGMTVERYGLRKGQTPADGARQSLSGLKASKRFKVLKAGKIESLKLADGAEAAYFRVAFLKNAYRKTHHMKLYAIGAGHAWVVSAWIVTGSKSHFAEKNRPLLDLLKVHAASLCFDEKKFSTKQLQAAYARPRSQPAARSRPAGKRPGK